MDGREGAEGAEGEGGREGESRELTFSLVSFRFVDKDPRTSMT